MNIVNHKHFPRIINIKIIEDSDISFKIMISHKRLKFAERFFYLCYNVYFICFAIGIKYDFNN